MLPNREGKRGGGGAEGGRGEGGRGRERNLYNSAVRNIEW